MFAKALKGQDIEELLSSIASAPVGGVAAAGSAPAGDAAPAKTEKGKIPFHLSSIIFYPYITK